jgi:RNA polymerase sigma factor (sigma-70 family)
MQDDLQLLQEFRERGSEEAFRALVERHAGMVHGVARRVAGENLAQEVTQTVFVLLARKANRLGSNVVLAGWLYRAARLAALEAIRREKRKQQIKEKLSAMSPDTSEQESLWQQIAPMLDEAMARLRNADREALLLRFFEGRSFAEVALATGSSEAAAKMRVSRALEKLRTIFSDKGVALSTLAIASTLSANAAPAASVITGAVLAEASNSAIPTLAEIAIKMILMKKLKMAAAVTVALLLVVGISVPVALSSKRVVTTFVPMSGEWTGTMEMNANGGKTTRPVELLVKTSSDGRHCDIDMRVQERDEVVTFHFSHELDASGRKISTQDDPRVRLLNGFGRVIESAQAPDQWRAGVRTEYPGGFSECRWIVHGDELKIARHDRMGPFLRRMDQYSTLELKRKTKALSMQ